NLHRARAADAQAQQARSDAEKLVGFLIEDFYNELEPTGRLETLRKLAHMTVSYYDGLPAELVTPRTRSLRAMALIREGAAMKSANDIVGAYKNFAEAQAVFEKLRAAGDKSEPVTYGLALSLFNQGGGVVEGVGRGTAEQLVQAVDLLRPLVRSSSASRESQQTYANILNYLSHSQPLETGVASCKEARGILAKLGALDLSDLRSTAIYADTADSEARHLVSLGRLDEAKVLEREVYSLAEKVLAQRPGDLKSLANRYLAAGLLGELARRQYDDTAADEFAQRSVEAAEDTLRFNPSAMENWVALVRAKSNMGGLQYESGEIAQTLATADSVLALIRDERRPASLYPLMSGVAGAVMRLQAQLGQTAAAEQWRQMLLRSIDERIAFYAGGDPRREIEANTAERTRADLQLIAGQAQSAFALATADLARLDKLKIAADNDNARESMQNVRRRDLRIASGATLRLGRYPQAEALLQQLQGIPRDRNSGDDPQEASMGIAAALAHAISLQGRNGEAQKLLQPALDYYRQEQQAGAHGTSFRYDFAYALYVSALTRAADTSERAKELTEASRLLDGASVEARQLADMRELARWIAAAQGHPQGGAPLG
ncbi:MAG: hypothetical protein ACREO7_13765, partial [Pseudoxanthomonas sp.]